MKPILNLKGLFVQLLKDRYDSETQQLESFPKLIEASHSLKLKHVINTCLENSETHIQKLERIFKIMNEMPIGDICEGTLGLINETFTMIEKGSESNIIDMAIITAIKQIHYADIAGYRIIDTYTRLVQNDEATRLIEEMLSDETKLDQMLHEMMKELILAEESEAIL